MALEFALWVPEPLHRPQEGWNRQLRLVGLLELREVARIPLWLTEDTLLVLSERHLQLRPHSLVFPQCRSEEVVDSVCTEVSVMMPKTAC